MRLKQIDRLLAVGAMAVLFGMASNLRGQSDVGKLSVTIHDKSSGEVVPAMVCITSLADNTWRIPPDGLKPAGHVTNPDIIAGRKLGDSFIAGTQKRWFPGDIGPAVLTAGYFEEDLTAPFAEKKRNPFYDGKPGVPFWLEPVAYFVSKPFSVIQLRARVKTDLVKWAKVIKETGIRGD